MKMEQREKGKSVDFDEEKWVYDSSLDFKGRVPLRATTGVWKASLFIIGNEFSERLSYFGIATSLIIYLTTALNQDLKTATRNTNYWTGVTTIMPLVGGFLADAYLGRFFTVLASSIVYLLGLILLTMSRLIPSLMPCDSTTCSEPRKIHKVIFFLAIYLTSIGTGGHKPSLESFGADQFDDNHPEERKKKMSFSNWWTFGLCSALLLTLIVVVFVQNRVSWAIADIMLTAVMACSLVVFCMGMPFYRYRKPTGSPLTPMAQVVVAAFSKRNLACPLNPSQLYEVPESQKTEGKLLKHTDKLKFLDKAAIVDDKQDSTEKQQNPWRLATVTQVEEMKLVLNTIPIWLTTLPFGICVAQASTFFIKQGTTLDHRIWHYFFIPPSLTYSVAARGILITSVIIYEKILVPVLRIVTREDRGIKILQRVGIGMVCSVVTMVVAALVERKRLTLVEDDPIKGSSTMSVFWLAPQFLILGVGDGFALSGLQEFFYDQVPDSMRSSGTAIYLSVMGAAYFINSWLITFVDYVTERSGRSWFGKDLNSSRLDNFYWLLAVITAVNFAVYVVLARWYTYKNVQERVVMTVTGCDEGDGVGAMVVA